MHALRLFFIALQFFTRIPIPRWVGFDPAWLQQAALFFPAVGWVVGAATAAVYWLAGLLWPPLVAAVLATIAGILLTGAFHEDGLADVCDGFGGGTSTERVLEIMKDSRLGAYGAIGIGLALLLKCSLLGSMPHATAVLALLLAHPLSRLYAVALIWRLPYARHEGKAKPLAQQMSGCGFAFALLSVLLPVAAILVWQRDASLAWHLGLGLVLAFLLSLKMARLYLRRLGGFTGDCLGAVQQLAELACYLGLAASWPAF
jgi:adenosylcobinamide-GDP ribazoletransferase